MRVLLVEDDLAMARAIARGLRADGISLDHAEDGHDGLWKAREGTYDALVLDLMVPGVGGFEICRQLRAQGCWTPILVLTACTGEDSETQALDCGADDFLEKPFSHKVLVARLRALARRPPVPDGKPLAAGSLWLDVDERACRWNGVPVQLTRREFAVLELLVRRKGRVVKRSELLDNVWGFDFEGDPQVVDVYVSYLRKKLDPDVIETVRGVGYRVDG